MATALLSLSYLHKMHVPVIDLSPFRDNTPEKASVVEAIGEACRTHGFFYIVGHGINNSLQKQLELYSRLFFEQDEKEKLRIHMAKGGKAWRGYFPVGNELTSGKPDLKEGLYFGSELPLSDPRVVRGIPLHGPNLFPDYPSSLKNTVLSYIDALTRLGHQLMRIISLSLSLPELYFEEHYTKDPLTLFRIFHYPSAPQSSSNAPLWGVGEHTDYGVLTILKQDDTGGLQVKTQSDWIDAPPVTGAFVCNIGDMLDRMTRGLYRSTPHRVLNISGNSRYSFPFFFDPSFNATISPINTDEIQTYQAHHVDRWDSTDLQEVHGTYGDYILAKVGKVFPELSASTLSQDNPADF